MTSHRPFPSHPDLRTFRNRVQVLLNAHASQDDGTPLSVEDARHAVAHEYGFYDWDALRTEIEPASTYTARAEAHKAALPPDLPEETSLEVVKALIDAGADINAGRQWRTHLGEFVTKGHLEVADLLIRHGAEVNKKNDQHPSGCQTTASCFLPTARSSTCCSRHRNRARERSRRRSPARTRRPPRRRAILTPDRRRWAGSLPMHGSLHGL